eukprot:scaffold44001_cov59-Phaeocystis_antarctica.AAC.4
MAKTGSFAVTSLSAQTELFETAFQRHGGCAALHLLLRAAHCLHACARFANGSTVQCATDPAAPIS